VPSPSRLLSPESKYLEETHGLRFIVYFTKISPKEKLHFLASPLLCVQDSNISGTGLHKPNLANNIGGWEGGKSDDGY
jgi:hypothetical protein